MAAELPEYDYEHIFIDNCSRISAVAILREIAASDRRVKILVEFTQFRARSIAVPRDAAIDGRRRHPDIGEYSDPARLDSEHGQALAERDKVVIAVKRSSDDRALWRLARDAYYKAMKMLSKVEQIPNYMGYGLYDKCVVDAMRGLREPEPYFRGLVVEVGSSGRWWNMISRRAEPGDQAIICSRWPIMRCWDCSAIRGLPCAL